MTRRQAIPMPADIFVGETLPQYRARKTLKRTRWFPGDVKPARPGVYERRWSSGVLFARWDGARWRTSWNTVAAAGHSDRHVSGKQNGLAWRGVANGGAA